MFSSALSWIISRDDFSKIGKIRENGTYRCSNSYQLRKFYIIHLNLLKAALKHFVKVKRKHQTNSSVLVSLVIRLMPRFQDRCFRVNFAKFLRTLFYRSSHWKCSVKKGFLKIYYNKTPALKFLFNKVAGSQACNFIKKKLQCRCFPVKFAKFSQTSILTDIYERLLLFLKENIHQPLVGFRFVFISRFRILIYCIFFNRQAGLGRRKN